MRDPLSNPPEKVIAAKNSLWEQLGPVLLLGSFAVVLVKCASIYWTLAVAACIGYFAILFFKRASVYLCAGSLAAVFVLLIRQDVALFWPGLICLSMTISWLLIFLGNRQIAQYRLDQEQKIQTIEENYRLLEHQLKNAKIALSQESEELSFSRHALRETQAELLALKNQMYEAKEIASKVEQLPDQIPKVELIDLKLPIESNLIPFENQDLEERLQIEQVRYQYANLREQFQEKSNALDQARKELFRVENALLVLQKAQEESRYHHFEEGARLIRDLKEMEQECCDLEAQISTLQEFITHLLSPKKRSVKPRIKRENQGKLPFMIQGKIEKISAESNR